MRLLHFEDGVFDADRVTLVEVSGNDIPRYGILSHTWGAAHEEVTFEDVMGGTGKQKLGYNKIRFCAQRANKELQYFWLDTCCIDKSDNVELQEALNSMFRWYANAAVCFVYLSDRSKYNWHGSRWFFRGWTLQELLAPKSVEFYSANGEYLGDRQSQAPEIHDITGIHGLALHGRALCRFSVSERLRWAESRSTTREEDMAYCLLGLFDVQMPIKYGEGRKQALFRLQERINASQETQGYVKPVAASIRKLIGRNRKPAQDLSPSLKRINEFASAREELSTREGMDSNLPTYFESERDHNSPPIPTIPRGPVYTISLPGIYLVTS